MLASTCLDLPSKLKCPAAFFCQDHSRIKAPEDQSHNPSPVMDTKEKEEKNKQGGEPQEGDNVESTEIEKNKQKKTEAGTAMLKEFDEAVEWLMFIHSSTTSEEEILAKLKSLRAEISASWQE